MGGEKVPRKESLYASKFHQRESAAAAATVWVAYQPILRVFFRVHGVKVSFAMLAECVGTKAQHSQQGSRLPLFAQSATESSAGFTYSKGAAF